MSAPFRIGARVRPSRRMQHGTAVMIGSEVGVVTGLWPSTAAVAFSFGTVHCWRFEIRHADTASKEH